MSARSIIVPKFTADDFDGKDFAVRITEAQAVLGREGYERIKVTQLHDAGRIVACAVTGQRTEGGNQASN